MQLLNAHNSCVDNKSECPNYVVCSFNPIRYGNGDCRKNLSDYPNLVHCNENFLFLCNDVSCCSVKILWQKPIDETICPDK